MKLKDKTILITGASSGIGRAMAIRAARDGATVLLAARSIDKLQSVASEVEKLGGKAEIIPCDVTDSEQIKQMFLKATENGRVLDVVYNNAGLGYINRIFNLKKEEIQQILDVNVVGMIMVSKYSAEVFSRQRYGHLMMTSSLAGLITLPEWSVYVASKWGILAFADCIRYELEPMGIKVTTIHPGPVKTEFFDKEKANIDISKMGDAVTAERVADESYAAIFTNKKRVLIPFTTKMFSFLTRYFPWLVNIMIKNMVSKVDYHNQNILEDESEFDYIKPISK